MVIVMNFEEKFNYLMNLTGTHNSELARSVAIDASLVSRWRNGSRSPAANQAMMEALGKFFAAKLKSGYQKAEMQLLLGNLYERYHGFLSYREILTLWLQGKAANADGLHSMLLDSGRGNAEKMIMLLQSGLLKFRNAQMWLLLNLPANKAEIILQEFLAFLAVLEKDAAARPEINIIIPGDILVKVFSGSIGKFAQNNEIFGYNLKWYKMVPVIGVFETVAFAVENVGGIAYSGLDFDGGGFNKVYSGGKLAQLLGMLKNAAAKSTLSAFNDAECNIKDFLNNFDRLKIDADLKTNALYVSDRSGVSRYIKADSERLWGLPTEKMLGRSTAELERSGSYYPSITRMVLESGKSVCTMQTTGTGCELLVIGMPLLDSDGKIEYIVNLSSEIKK